MGVSLTSSHHTLCRRTWTSKVKYFLRFLMIMTRKGSLMPRVFFGFAGHITYVVLRGKERERVNGGD